MTPDDRLVKTETVQPYYEARTGKQAIYRKDGADYHTLAYVRWLESRLAEERFWGHRNCVQGNCYSSGTDCPAQKETPHDT